MIEYIQILNREPLIIDVCGDKYTFPIFSVSSFIRFNSRKNYIFDCIEKLNELRTMGADMLKLKYFEALCELLWSHCERNFIKRLFGRGRFKKRLMQNIDYLIQVYEKILRYNAEVKKKAQAMHKYQIWAFNPPTIGGKPFSAYIKTDESGKKYLTPRHLLN